MNKGIDISEKDGRDYITPEDIKQAMNENSDDPSCAFRVATYRSRSFSTRGFGEGKASFEPTTLTVEVMAVVGHWAMVRTPPRQEKPISREAFVNYTQLLSKDATRPFVVKVELLDFAAMGSVDLLRPTGAPPHGAKQENRK